MGESICFRMMFGGMWSEVKGSGDKPEPRAESAMCASGDGSKLFIFGGQIHNKAFNDLWQFEIASSSWSKLDAPNGPPPRWGCTLSFFQNKLFLFGGEEVNPVEYKHLYVFDLSKNAWENPEQSGAAPTPRANHTAHVISIKDGSGLLVYAGKDIHSSREFADLKVLNLQSMEWYNPYFPVHGGDPDEIPPCRKRHASVVHNNKFYVYAGWQGNRNTGSYWSDFYILDLETMVWSNPSTRGVTPEARAGHAAAIYNDKFFVWGGWGSLGRGNYGELNYMELDDFTWNRYRRGKPPAERFDMSHVLVGEFLWVFGGQLDPQSREFTNELWKGKLSAVY